MMRKRTKTGSNIVIGLAILLTTLPAFAQIEFTGDLSVLSTYVWRGVKINNGTAVQSSATAAYGIFSLGFWGSSVNFSPDVEVETDVIVNANVLDGDVNANVGATIYMLDFRTFNDAADAELELYITAGYGALGLNAYYVPEQNSTKPSMNRSNYWLELSAYTEFLGADLSGVFSYGTYSSRFMPMGEKKDAVALAQLTAGKSVNDAISVYWSYSLDIGSDFENIFYFGAIYGF